MGAAERRLEMMKYLTRHRHATMPELAELYGVSVRTVQRDVLELETVLGLPLTLKAGRYGGGIYVLDSYRPDRLQLHPEESALLSRVYETVKDHLPQEDAQLFSVLLQKYSRAH